MYTVIYRWSTHNISIYNCILIYNYPIHRLSNWCYKPPEDDQFKHDEYRLPELSGRGESGEDETVFGDGMKGPSERVNQHYPLVNIQKTMENHYF